MVWAYVVPRALRKESAGGTALGLAVPAALLVVPAFWSGLPLVLGVAALLVGNAGRKAPTGAGKCIAAIALAAVTVLFYLSIYVTEAVGGETGFLLELTCTRGVEAPGPPGASARLTACAAGPSAPSGRGPCAAPASRASGSAGRSASGWAR